MVDGYVALSTERIKVTRNGNPQLKPLSPEDLLHTKSTWEIMGISQGRLPSLYNPDGSEAYMTMNGLPVDLTDDKTIRRLDQIRNYPSSIVNESLEVISKTINKHFKSKVEKKKETCLYGAIETFQEAKITLQNLLFVEKAKIMKDINDITSKIVLDFKSAAEMRDSLTLNIAMLEQAEAKVTGYGNDERAVMIIDNFWDHLRNHPITTPDAVSLTQLLHELRTDRRKNICIDLYTLLDRIVGVFKPEEESGETLHAALMACHVNDQPAPRPRYEHVGDFSGAKGNGGGKESVRVSQDPQALKTPLRLLLGSCFKRSTI